MDLKNGLKNQYHVGLAMLRQCVRLCPDDLWESGEHPRSTWRIAYHAAYYTHLYLHASRGSFTPWSEHVNDVSNLWGRPKVVPAISRESVLSYIEQINAETDTLVDNMDLDAVSSGFALYKIPKLEHQFVNLRHLQHHIGQLSELLMARGIEIDWPM